MVYMLTNYLVVVLVKLFNEMFFFVVVDPRLTDYDTLLDNLHGLKDGKSVQVPIYDFKSSSRIGYRY